MNAAVAWLAGFWQAVWPNLAASVLWVPVTLVGQHLVVRWHMKPVHAHLAELRRRVSPPLTMTTGSGNVDAPPAGLKRL